MDIYIPIKQMLPEFNGDIAYIRAHLRKSKTIPIGSKATGKYLVIPVPECYNNENQSLITSVFKEGMELGIAITKLLNK